ncbi:probable G-protein coupled receptor Mth-like 3 [Hetaerina americana]|uniref:probable G-protein coupled receptor Mth-like 3 n=1 Tax=Hetaerina americana TaxID=62018 RepID=UPI003A7F178D
MSGSAAAFCMTCAVLVTLHAVSYAEVCEPSMSVEIPNVLMMGNGSAWDPDDRAEYRPGTFWSENGTTRGCPCMQDRPCLRKCCQRNQAMDFKTLECIPIDEPVPWFRPKLRVDEEGNSRVAEFGEFGILYGNFCFGYLLEPDFYPEDEFHMDYDNASLKVARLPIGWLGTKDFCVDYFPEVNSYLPYVCFSGFKLPKEDEKCDKLRFVLYPIGMVISIVFIVASLAVYAIEPKLRNLCGKCMIFYMCSLLSSYVTLTTVQVIGESIPDGGCRVFGFIIYFSLLCTFFWLNILCIDITLTFRASRSIAGNPAERDRKKFVIYSVYAWGMPLLITAICMVTELHPGVPDHILKPHFELTCWFYDDRSRFLYFICPVGLIIFCNLCLFLVTAFNICTINRNNQKCKAKRDKLHCSKADKKRLSLYVKLYIVMGLTWMMEILSFVIGGSKCIWLFPDMVNTLQGLFIFLILICNRKIVGVLRRRFVAKMSAPDDPVTRLDESGTSSEDDEDLKTSSTSTDANAASGPGRNEFRLKSKAATVDGVEQSLGRVDGDAHRREDK